MVCKCHKYALTTIYAHIYSYCHVHPVALSFLASAYTLKHLLLMLLFIQFLEHQFILCDKDMHFEHLAKIDSCEGGRAASTLNGINHNSILNELAYFHVCSGALLPDVMHDILEGALQYEMKLMLKVFLSEEKYLTLSELNNQLQSFELGYMECKDRPSPISEAHFQASSGASTNTLKQSGTILTIFVYLID